MTAMDKNDILVNAVISPAEMKTQAEAEITLPDYLPDIMRIVKTDATILMGDIFCEKDLVKAFGEVVFTIIYQPENSLSLRSIKAKAPFECNSEVKGATDLSRVYSNEKVSFINCKPSSARRISAVAGLFFGFTVECEKKIKNVKDELLQNSDVESKAITKNCCSYAGSGEKNFRLEEDIEIPDQNACAMTIVCQNIEPVILDYKPLADKVAVSGEARVKTIYITDFESGTMETLISNIPFNQIVDVDGATENSKCYPKIRLKNCEYALYENRDGENRIISVTADFCLTCTAYECRDISLLTDAYSPTKNCEIKYRTDDISRMNGDVKATMPLKSNITLPHPVESVISSSVTPFVKSAQISGGKIFVEGEIEISFIIKYADGAIESYDANEKFNEEMPYICESSRVSCNVEAALENSSVIISGEELLEVRGTIILNGSVLCMESVEHIEEIITDEAAPAKYNPYMVLYYPADGEPIWDIAKKYKSTVSKIQAANNLVDDCADGKMLIIPRSRV